MNDDDDDGNGDDEHTDEENCFLPHIIPGTHYSIP